MTSGTKPQLRAKACDFSIRSASLADAADLHANCFPEQALNEVQDYLRWCLAQQAKGRMVRLVAEADGLVVANGQFAILRGQGEIGSLVVAPAYRRRGIGTALISALIEQARRGQMHTIEITAHLDKPWVQAWYQRLGFAYTSEHDFGDERVAVLHMALARHPKGDDLCPTL
jgi:ribosomal protein S18 acetylase RimI-like enzyme